jgi:hypothetical protein
MIDEKLNALKARLQAAPPHDVETSRTLSARIFLI